MLYTNSIVIKIDDVEFEKIVAEAIDAIPERFYSRIKNVVFTAEDFPSHEQRVKLKLRHDQSLFGLYEGIPLGNRASNYNLVLPDKITLFKGPILQSSNTIEELRDQVHKTIWHEVAHYFGLSHEDMDALNNKDL
jgi:predicted Zn-dependent protease with MMP-like domain